MSDLHHSLKKTLADLVAIDSTSSRSNVPVIDYLEAPLKRAGFSIHRHRYTDTAGVEKHNLLAVKGGKDAERPELALVGHSDCVPFDPAWEEALRLTEREGKLYGRGACDTKAYVACATWAAIRASERLDKPLLVLFTADEEAGCFGAKRLVDAQLGRARFAIVGEPTSLTPVVAHKGYCLAEVEVRGREGHSAYPSVGRPAILRAARFLKRFEELASDELSRENDVRFEPPHATFNVGLIAGGKAKNVIPGSCRFTVEWRPLPTQPVDAVSKLLERVRDELRRAESDFEATIEVFRGDRGVDTSVSSEVVQHLVRESGNAPATVPFGTEAPQLTALGAEAVVFGPGDIRVAHRTGEFVPVSELVRCEEILERAIGRFCAPARGG